MSSFTEEPYLMQIGDNQWRLVKGFSFYITDDKLLRVDIPAGFVTDFASVPRIFWSILPPFGVYTKSAILHDYLYSLAGKITREGVSRNVFGEEFEELFFTVPTRKQADDMFLKGMSILGVSWLKRYTMWLAVRAVGWMFFNRIPIGESNG